MLNKVIFEGLVTNTWRYGSDLFVRLASYRDPGVPVKRFSNEARDEPDYVNVRFTNGAQGQRMDFAPGTLLRVEGLLQSREYNESLAEFIDKARKVSDSPVGIELIGQQARHILCGRSTIEILALQQVVVQQPRPVRQAPRKPVVAVPEKAEIVETIAAPKEGPAAVEGAGAA